VTAVRATEGAELVACSDLDGEIARDLADEHDVESVYTDTSGMTADVDALLEAWLAASGWLTGHVRSHRLSMISPPTPHFIAPGGVRGVSKRRLDSNNERRSTLRRRLR
jgi:hypothetical protein